MSVRNTPDPLLDAFVAERRDLVQRFGAEAFDQAQVLYISPASDRRVVVRDAFPGAPGAGAVEFVRRVDADWWQARRTFAGGAEPGVELRARRGLYARYLPEVGFHWLIEFDEEGPTGAWRVAARGPAEPIALPEDEGMFRDQTGTFLDVREGWRFMVETFARTGEHEVVEVQSGYYLGVRAGVPGDPAPADREDEELMSHFSRWDPREYDTLEFLNGPDADDIPLPGARYPEWLAERAPTAAAQEIDLFVLADSTAFVECVADLAAPRAVEVRPTEDGHLRLLRGPLRVEAEMARPYLQAVHGGHSFVEAARAFFLPTLVALDEAATLLDTLRARLPGHGLRISEGTTLVITREGVEVGRWNLLGLVGRQLSLGEQGLHELLTFMGYDADTDRFSRADPPLDVCPVCAAPAQVNKVIRPRALLGVDPRTLAGVAVGQHLVFYTRDCPAHVTPVEPRPDRPLGVLEGAYRDGLAAAALHLAAVSPFGEGGALLVGFDAGSLVLEAARVKAALLAAGLPAVGRMMAYAFGPDALLVVPQALAGADLLRARQAAEDAVRGRYPGRGWPLDVARGIDLEVDPLGQVTVAE